MVIPSIYYKTNQLYSGINFINIYIQRVTFTYRLTYKPGQCLLRDQNRFRPQITQQGSIYHKIHQPNLFSLSSFDKFYCLYFFCFSKLYIFFLCLRFPVYVYRPFYFPPRCIKYLTLFLPFENQQEAITTRLTHSRPSFSIFSRRNILVLFRNFLVLVPNTAGEYFEAVFFFYAPIFASFMHLFSLPIQFSFALRRAFIFSSRSFFDSVGFVFFFLFQIVFFFFLSVSIFFSFYHDFFSSLVSRSFFFLLLSHEMIYTSPSFLTTLSSFLTLSFFPSDEFLSFFSLSICFDFFLFIAIIF